MRAFTVLLGLSTALIAGVAALSSSSSQRRSIVPVVDLPPVAVVDAPPSDCDSGPFSLKHWIGDIHDEDKTDIEICETQWKQGAVVKGIEVWATSSNLAGIQFTYSNDDVSHVIGSKEGDHHQKLQWDPKLDTVDELHMWSNPPANRLGKIYIKLSNGDTLDVGMDHPAETTHYMERHSGIMLGGFGKADSAVTGFGFLFLEDTVAKISLSDFKFDDDQDTFASQQRGIEHLVFDSMSQYTTATNASQLQIERLHAKANTYTYSQAVKFTFGLKYELEISAQVAGAGPKATFGVEFKIETESKKEWSQSETTTLTFKVLQPAIPNYTTMCIGTTETGTFDGNYEAKVHITLKNGRTFDFRERGKRTQVFFGRSRTRCADREGDHEDMDPEDFVESDNPKRDLGGLIPTKFIA